MKIIRTLVIVLPMFAVLTLSGCKGQVNIDSIEDNLNIVCDRHDAYVNSGKGPDGKVLTDLEKRVYLRSTAGLRGVITAAKK